jgi:hypothetical protein
MKVPLEYIHFYVKVPKIAKKVFWSSDLLRKGHSLRVQALYKGPKFFFFIISGFWVSKDAEFNVDCKNTNLPNKNFGPLCSA